MGLIMDKLEAFLNTLSDLEKGLLIKECEICLKTGKINSECFQKLQMLASLVEFNSMLQLAEILSNECRKDLARRYIGGMQ